MYTEASFWPNSIDSLCLQLVHMHDQVSISPDLVIFVSMTTRTTKPITLPLARVHGVANNITWETCTCMH